jgi:RecA-family ATPase
VSGDAWAVTEPTFCEECGRENCEGHARADTSAPGLMLQRAIDVMAAPAPVEIVEGIVCANTVTILPAESGTGKTFVLLDLQAAVCDGTPWHGRETLQGCTAHISYEGDALNLRLRAIAQHTPHRLEHVFVLRGTDPITPRLTRDGEERSIGERALSRSLSDLVEQTLREQLPPLRLVVMDTVRASHAGSDDASDAAAAYLRSIRRLMTLTPDAAWILSHHAGWQDGETQRKRERGSSTWRGNVDGTLYLERTGDYDKSRGEQPLTLTSLKVRDGEPIEPIRLIRRRVELAERDRYGRPLTSCIVERDFRTSADRAAERSQAAEVANREADLAVLKAMRDYPAATSISRLRPYVGLRTEAVSASIARILRAGWAVEGRRGQPFAVTPDGLAHLKGSHQ